ncbi:MAG: hypothetical protein HY073_00940 [Deltaproteobacteria bacterium]|nr:hypothetical protein [Deltaproteobacteria bacterium]
MIEGPQWEMDESALDDLRLYFTSKGSHTVSEILVDPRFVEIRVVRPYAISLKDFIDKIFANDPMVGRPPAHVNDVLERVKSWVPGHLLNEYGSEAIKKTAVKRFIEIELDSVLAEAGDYHPFDVSIDGQKMTHIKLWLIRCALEAANPYEGVDPEYKILVKRMKELESDITSRGHLIYLGYLAESGRGSSGAKNFDRWEKRYREACVIAGVSPNEEAVIKARSQIGAK